LLKHRQLIAHKQPLFSDIKAGDEIGPLIKGPYNVIMMARFAGVSGDFYPSHYDNKWAVEKSHHPSAIAHGLQLSCYLSQLVTDWMGPNSFMTRFSSQNRDLTLDGDTVTFRGRVIRKYTLGKENLVELELWGDKQSGPRVIAGAATVRFP
jgi:acyl dehydratase